MFGSLLRREERAVQATVWGEWQGDNVYPTWSGSNVTTASALQLLTVYGCVRFICDGIATLPLDLFRKTDNGPQDLPTRPLWLDRPTIDLDRTAWVTQVIASLLLAGNAYVQKRLDSAGNIVELQPLDPSKVTVNRDASGAKTYTVGGSSVPASRILHIPGVMFPGSDVGLSPVEAARQSIGQGMAAQEFGARFFSQGGGPDGVIEMPTEPPPEKARDLARQWARKHSGKQNAHLPGVLTGGATWKQTSITNEQAQFLQTRGFTAAEIAGQMFLIDPSELGIPSQEGSSSITYANLEQRNARLVRVTYLPWIVRLEMALSSLLVRPRYVKFNVGGLLRGDMKTRFDSYAVGITNKFMTPNEAREFEDWSPLPGGDTVVEPPQPPEAPNDDTPE